MDTIKKFQSGEKLATSDWEAYLQDAHKKSPSMTPYAFSVYCRADGLNSYEWLAKNAADHWAKNPEADSRPADILDLACGDGYLYPKLAQAFAYRAGINYTGVDMSEGELTIARERIGKNENVTLLQERAQTLSLADYSQDIVVSHMAFMLMTPAEEVLREISRVLRPGGKFFAIVNSRKMGGEFMKAASDVMIKVVDANIPNIENMPMGDSRVISEEQLNELIVANGLEELSVDTFAPFDLKVRDRAENIWRLYRDMYIVDLMPNREIERLRLALQSVANKFADDKGQIAYDFPMVLIGITKRAEQ